MLTQLITVKSRLALLPGDLTYDTLLTTAIEALTSRFDHETHRTLARTVDFQQEFDPTDTEILASCYPIESVTKFELKTSESEGWLEQPDVDYFIRRGCIISLNTQLSTLTPQRALARVTYTGGYTLPDDPAPPPVAVRQNLPPDLEQAAVEQLAFWFQTRDKLGLKSNWPSSGTYEQFAQFDLLPSVQATLKKYEKWHL